MEHDGIISCVAGDNGWCFTDNNLHIVSGSYDKDIPYMGFVHGQLLNKTDWSHKIT